MIDAAHRGKARAEDEPALAPHVTTHAGLRGAAREGLVKRGRERGGVDGVDPSPACTGWDVEGNRLTAASGFSWHRMDLCESPSGVGGNGCNNQNGFRAGRNSGCAARVVPRPAIRDR